VRTTTALRQLPEVVIAANWPKHGFKTNPRIRFRATAQERFKYSKLVEWDIQDFHSDPRTGQLTFALAHVDGAVNMCFRLGNASMVTCLDAGVGFNIEPAHDSWIPFAVCRLALRAQPRLLCI